MTNLANQQPLHGIQSCGRDLINYLVRFDPLFDVHIELHVNTVQIVDVLLNSSSIQLTTCAESIRVRQM